MKIKVLIFISGFFLSAFLSFFAFEQYRLYDYEKNLSDSFQKCQFLRAHQERTPERISSYQLMGFLLYYREEIDDLVGDSYWPDGNVHVDFSRVSVRSGDNTPSKYRTFGSYVCIYDIPELENSIFITVERTEGGYNYIELGNNSENDKVTFIPNKSN